MTWREAQVALQLEAEERIGQLLRQRTEQAHADEDAAMKATMEALGGSRR